MPKIATTLTLLLLASRSMALAQSPPAPRVFVDASFVSDHDSIGDFQGPPTGEAVRAAVGRRSGHHDWRLEVDVPSWRKTDRDFTGPVYCAQDSNCGPGYVPFHIVEHSQVRTISTAFLYAQHLPTIGRVELSLVGGVAVESQLLKYSQQSDELDSAGRVVNHSAYAHDYPVGSISGVMGVDAQVRLTSHLAVVPQLRYHYFPYPDISILRPGAAVRWQF